MIAERVQLLHDRLDSAVAEIQERILSRYPEATF